MAQKAATRSRTTAKKTTKTTAKKSASAAKPVDRLDDAIAIREMCYISLSFDHRLIDGAVAEQFMGELKRSLMAITDAGL